MHKALQETFSTELLDWKKLYRNLHRLFKDRASLHNDEQKSMKKQKKRKYVEGEEKITKSKKSERKKEFYRRKNDADQDRKL